MVFDKTSEIIKNEEFLKLDNFLSDRCVVLKLENMNLSGSVKHKPALEMIKELEQKNLIKKGQTVVESSSGNMGVALAMICAERGYQFTCVTDPNISPSNINLMRAFGAEVISVTTKIDGGYVKERLRKIDEILTQNPDAVWVDQYSNSANWRSHYKHTAAAIHKNISDIDFLFVGVGSSGTMMGCQKYFEEHLPHVKIIAVEPEGSSLFGKEIKNRNIPGIGGNVLPKIFCPEVADDVVVVKERETVEMCHRMAKRFGFLAGGSTGTLLSGIEQYQHSIPAGSTVVAIAADSGSNYLNTIYDQEWVAKHIE